MRSGLSLLAAVVAAVAIGRSALAAPPPMLLPGQMDVSPSGAFTYTVPITVPPGTAGMVPSLSLEYSSQSGDGIMGLGWSLTGLPSIGRCPRTIAQDAIRGSVNYDANDRFCMEGQRLVAITGTYGADLTEYRTEIEGFSKIVSFGTAGTGPAWFKVWTKSGQIMEFGNTTDSRILAQGITTARSWAVNKISDTKGNYLTVTYTNDTTNGVAYPSRIDYTGNAAAALTPYNSVRFTYNTNRPDQVPLYHAGKLQKTTVLLTNVKAYEGVNVVRDYQITYELGTTLRRSRITQIKLCDAATPTPNCLAPTTFGWQGSRDTINVSVTSAPFAQGYNLFVGDFNADGLTDPLTQDARCSPTSSGTNYASTQSGTFVTTNYVMIPAAGGSTTAPFCAALAAQSGVRSIAGLADFDGDGITDWRSSEPGVGGAVASNFYYSNGVSSLYQAVITSSWPDPLYAYLGDFDGDGRTDFFYRPLNGTTGTFYASTGRNGTTSFTSGIAQSGFGGTISSIGDFDGNGCSDILQQGTANSVTLLCDAAIATYAVTNWTHSNIRLTFGDFNGDGATDILETNTDWPGGGVYLSTGTGTFTTGWTTPTAWGRYPTFAADFNGDGRSDIALIGYRTCARLSCTNKNHEIWLSTGSGFVQAATVTNTMNQVGTTSSAVVADWDNNGAADIWFKTTAISGDQLFTIAFVPEFMNSVSNGLGITTTITYDRINKPAIYTKDTNAAYPTVDINGPLYVVSRVDSGNGIGGTYSSTYKYVGLKADYSGRDFLGFRQRIVTDLQTNIVETTTLRQDYPYTGLVASQTRVLNTVTLNSKTNAFAATNLGGTRYLVSLTQTVDATNDLNGSALPTITTAYQYDAYGNATQITVTTPNGDSEVTTNTYTNDTTNWILGLIATSTQTNTVSGVTVTRQMSYTYNATTGQLTQELVEPNTLALKLQTDYGYDAFGNRATVTTSGVDIPFCTSTITYDARGQFPASTTNCGNQSTTGTFDQRHGGIVSTTDLNGLLTTASYDAFGRPTLRTDPSGTKTSAAYAYCSGVNGGTATCVSGGVFFATSTPLAADGATQNGAQSKTYFDALARVIAQDTQGFDGSLVRVATQYDANGRVAQVSRPYFVAGGTPKWTVTTYDVVGRTVDIQQPNGGHVTTVYNGQTTSVTNPLNQTTTTVKNQQDQIASITDNAGTTTYTYDPFDNIKTITDSAGNVTTFTYDVRGRKIAATDPDLGLWQYAYNVLGDLVSQTDAKNQTATLTYDNLRRITQRVELGLTSTFTYDTAFKGVGKLASDNTSSGASHTYAYDSLSRPITTTTTVDGNSYSVTTTYDANGRPDVITYPSGFAVRHEYTSLGYLQRLMNNATSTALWTANAANAEMQITQEMSGNGVVTNRAFDANTGLVQTIQAGVGNVVANYAYSFNTIGSLTSRSDTINSVTENFTYDNMNRLTQYAIVGGATKTVGYSAVGNIASKSDVGTYAYPTAGTARPHAVGSITGTVNTIFTYDANGNMIAGQGRTVTYTSFNMTASITQGSATVSLYYDAHHTRIKQVAPEGTTIYVAGPVGVERFAASSGLVQWNEYLSVGEQRVGEHFTRSDSTQNTRHFVLDHLGSVSVITDEMGTVVERLAYDAWGKRRHPNGADDPTGSITSQTARGFTGHEHIASLGLINMNARVYDPLIGRFMTPDTVLEDPYFAQILNRYTYVGNNPLSIVDPTGHSWLSKLIRAIFRNPLKFFAVLIFAVEIGPLIGSWAVKALAIKGVTGAFVAGFVAGFTTGVFVAVINGGKFWAALRNGLWNGLSMGLTGIIDRWQTTVWKYVPKPGQGWKLEHILAKVTHWNEVVAKSLLIGAKDALIAKLRRFSVTAQFWQSTIFAALREIYRAFVPYEEGPRVFGSGDRGAPKGEGDVIGPSERTNDWGIPRNPGQPPSGGLEEGSWISRFFDGFVPFMHATAKIHDVWSDIWRNGICLGSGICATTMLPAFTVTVGATLRDVPIGASAQSGCRRDAFRRCEI